MKEMLYGRNAVYEALRAKRRELFGLQLAEGVQPSERVTEILELAKKQRVPVTRVPRARLERLNANHQGVALEAGEYPYADVVDTRSLKARAPACTLAGSSRPAGALSWALRTIELVRTFTSAHLTMAGSSWLAATLWNPPKKNTAEAIATTIASNPITAKIRIFQSPGVRLLMLLR